jgi:arsenate reductase (glutaredoxin)
MIKMYGIPNCDTVKKAMSFLNSHHLPFEFHNYKTEGISVSKLTKWCRHKGWETLFNKRSSTWKDLKLTGNIQVDDQAKAIEIMQANTSIIKRPVIEFNEEIIVGFSEKEYLEAIINNKAKN